MMKPYLDDLRTRVVAAVSCEGLDLIHRSMSDFAIHPTARIIGEADSILSRTRATLVPAKPMLRILDRIDPLANLAAMG
jgi:hypothetical protein